MIGARGRGKEDQGRGESENRGGVLCSSTRTHHTGVLVLQTAHERRLLQLLGFAPLDSLFVRHLAIGIIRGGSGRGRRRGLGGDARLGQSVGDVANGGSDDGCRGRLGDDGGGDRGGSLFVVGLGLICFGWSAGSREEDSKRTQRSLINRELDCSDSRSGAEIVLDSEPPRSARR
jgi:hypothetical protein